MIKIYPASRSTGNPKAPFTKELVEDIEVTLSNKDEIFIGKGFDTDFASVPRFLWGFVSPFGRDEVAFVVHDYLYKYKEYQKGIKIKKVTRRFADQQMYKLQLSHDVSWWRAFLMYSAVRMFGWYWWHGWAKKVRNFKQK